MWQRGWWGKENRAANQPQKNITSSILAALTREYKAGIPYSSVCMGILRDPLTVPPAKSVLRRSTTTKSRPGVWPCW